MLLFITGATGSGKTTVVRGLKKRLPEYDIHDFDERGIEDTADTDTRWRQEQTEYWINKAAENQRLGKDTVICGGAVYGEILACPSIQLIDHLAVCLLDCDDIVRVDRLRKFGGQDPDLDILAWAAWLRVHAVDSTWCREVIMRESFDAMRWENWIDWERGDPRWQQTIIDTGRSSIDQITSAVVKWIGSQVSTKDVNPLVRDQDNGMDALMQEEERDQT